MVPVYAKQALSLHQTRGQPAELEVDKPRALCSPPQYQGATPFITSQDNIYNKFVLHFYYFAKWRGFLAKITSQDPLYLLSSLFRVKIFFI